MDIGARIKKRRKELRISADKLGHILGKNRATIFRYENGDIENLPLDVLEPIAKALQTTPQYLMGWSDEYTDKEDAEAINALGYIHPKEELPPEIEAINTLLYPEGLQIMKTNGSYYFDEAGQLSEEELNEFLNTVTTMVKSVADGLIKKKKQGIKDYFNNKKGKSSK